MTARTQSTLPPWRTVLVVVAHPDDESFGLGAVISTYRSLGAEVAVLCLTRGGASTLHGVDGDLTVVRARELEAAARVLDVGTVRLLDHPDGALEGVDLQTLVAAVLEAADEVGAEGLLVFDDDGVTGHPDHVRATAAAVAAAVRRRLGVLAWTLPADVAGTLADEYGPGFTGHPRSELDVELAVDRSRQRAAVACHPSQALPGSVLWRRLDLLGDREHLRWLVRPGGGLS